MIYGVKIDMNYDDRKRDKYKWNEANLHSVKKDDDQRSDYSQKSFAIKPMVVQKAEYMIVGMQCDISLCRLQEFFTVYSNKRKNGFKLEKWFDSKLIFFF